MRPLHRGLHPQSVHDVLATCERHIPCDVFDHMAPRSPISHAYRVLVVSEKIDDLLMMRRLVLQTPFSVEAARSAAQALELLKTRRFAAIISDELLRGGAQLLEQVAVLRPEMLRVLLGSTDVDRGAPAGAHRMPRPYYARPLTTLLRQHALRTVDVGRDDDTVPTATRGAMSG